MAGEVQAEHYKDVVLFLATAGVVVPVFKRLKISPVLGFLGAGVALGPFGLGALGGAFPWLRSFTIDNPEQIAQLAEFGVVFLLFMIGLELSWERLRALRRLVFGLGGLQVTICGLAIGGGAWMLGQPLAAAAAIAGALALSSTAIVMQLLTERKRQHSQAGRTTFSVLLFQDLAVAPILITLALLGRQESDFRWTTLLLSFVPAALGLAALVVFGRLMLRPMLRSVAKAKSEELFMAAALLVVIGAGLLSAAAGLSMALGAFIAGVLLAETEYRHEVEVTIEPFKGLLLGLFFVSVGIQLDLSLLVAQPIPVLATALGVTSLNASVIFVLARLYRVGWRPALESALLLAGGGEFAFVVLNTAMGEGIVDRGLGQTILVASTLSMFCIPLLALAGARLAGRPAEGAAPSEAPEGKAEAEVQEAVVVVGYGRVGKLVGDMLSRHDIAWVAAERDPKLIEAGRRAGHDVFFGDATRVEFLRRCGLDTARALVVTMDNPEGAEAIVAAAREARPDLTVVARARDARHAKRLYELGATDAVPETIEASLQLSEAVLVDIGTPMGLVIASIHERRDEYRKALNRPDALGARGRRARDRLQTQ
ncbi:MAG: potassium transporter TrkA [Caulobacterales bacterium 68-7]|nr:cation:proton antiporter [Caulobacterales bacterium]OJU12236.1 MAG: potassium transporter TrkA [Caulobacterales bacterium 68-7]